jgi:hypothetical protein
MSDALPAALRPFAVELEGIAPDVIAALAPLLLRTLNVLTSAAPPTRSDDGEPDGYGGFVRRGPWDRLLLSEWALLDEVPDEFIRRVAAGEQLFHELEHTTHKRAGVVVALFDVGGDQLGRPRIAQLALAIVLAAQARARGATFLFGTLTGTRTAGRTTLLSWSTSALHHLRDARARTNSTDDDAISARQGIDELVLEPDAALDVVMVGGARTARRSWPLALHVFLDDVLEIDARTVALRVDHRGIVRTAALPLPDDRICTRLMRDPLVLTTPKPKPRPTTTTTTTTTKRQTRARFRKGEQTAIDPHHPLLTTMDGRRVLARLVDGSVLSIALPARPPGAPEALSWGRTIQVPGTLVAAGGAGKALQAVAVDDAGGCILHSAWPGSIALQGTTLPIPRKDGRFTVLALANADVSAEERRLYFVDGAERLFLIEEHHRRLRLVEDRAILLSASTTDLRYASLREGKGGTAIEIVSVNAQGSGQIVQRRFVGDGSALKLFDVGDGGRIWAHSEGTRWVEWAVGTAQLQEAALPLVAEPHGVIGVVRHQHLGLVMATTRELLLFTHDTVRALPDTIVQACVAANAKVPMIVVLREDGSLTGRTAAGTPWRVRPPTRQP